MYIVPVFVPHAGCPHACTFCNQHAISGQQKFSPEQITTEILRFMDYLPVSSPKQIAFYGGSFTALPMQEQEELLARANQMFAEYNVESLRISTRPDCLSESILKLIKKYHVTMVELGVQSMDNRVLALAKRGHTKTSVVEGIKLLRKFDMGVGVQLMVGMQGQDFASIKETAEEIIALQPDIARIYHLLVLKDTELEKRYLQGTFRPLGLKDAVEQATYLWEVFMKAGVRVVRMGLQADESLEENIVAGEYHPAFGELVIQNHYLHRMIEFLRGFTGTQVVISYPQDLESKIVGFKKSNKMYLYNNFPQIKFSWRRDDSLTDLQVSLSRHG